SLNGAQAGLITDDNYNEAKIKKVKSGRIKHELKTHDVVVVAGLQGRTEDGDITTIVRGGSDTTAAAFGESLRAESVEIFTDVETLITSSRGKEKGIDIPDRLVTGIAHIDDISQIDVKIDNQDIEKQALVFEKMAEADISVDFINVSLSNVIYTVSNDDLEEA